MKSNRNIYLCGRKKHPFKGYPAVQHSKKQQICHYRHTKKTRELFLLFNAGVKFSLRNNFANSGFFAKVSVPVHIYNSLADHTGLLELCYLCYVYIVNLQEPSSKLKGRHRTGTSTRFVIFHL